jgi:hypothetical protein
MKHWICLTLTLLFLVEAHSAEKIGKVVAVQGELKAMDANQTERMLNANSEIFIGDTLFTDQTATGKVKFTDGTTVLLIPGTQYAVDQYSQQDGIYRYFSHLIEGGVQIATGLIAKKNPENFSVGTPNATIGVRGTVFEARVLDGDVFVGSSSGKISVKNQGGSLDLGSGSSDQFAKVSSMDTAPEPLATRPEALDFSHFGSPGNTGMAAATGGSMATNNFAWGIGLGGLAVIGTVVGTVVTAATQSSSQNTTTSFAHQH